MVAGTPGAASTSSTSSGTPSAVDCTRPTRAASASGRTPASSRRPRPAPAAPAASTPAPRRRSREGEGRRRLVAGGRDHQGRRPGCRRGTRSAERLGVRPVQVLQDHQQRPPHRRRRTRPSASPRTPRPPAPRRPRRRRVGCQAQRGQRGHPPREVRVGGRRPVRRACRRTSVIGRNGPAAGPVPPGQSARSCRPLGPARPPPERAETYRDRPRRSPPASHPNPPPRRPTARAPPTSQAHARSAAGTPIHAPLQSAPTNLSSAARVNYLVGVQRAQQRGERLPQGPARIRNRRSQPRTVDAQRPSRAATRRCPQPATRPTPAPRRSPRPCPPAAPTRRPAAAQGATHSRRSGPGEAAAATGPAQRRGPSGPGHTPTGATGRGIPARQSAPGQPPLDAVPVLAYREYRCLRAPHRGPPGGSAKRRPGGPLATPTRSRCRRTRTKATHPRLPTVTLTPNGAATPTRSSRTTGNTRRHHVLLHPGHSTPTTSTSSPKADRGAPRRLRTSTVSRQRNTPASTSTQSPPHPGDETESEWTQSRLPGSPKPGEQSLQEPPTMQWAPTNRTGQWVNDRRPPATPPPTQSGRHPVHVGPPRRPIVAIGQIVRSLWPSGAGLLDHDATKQILSFKTRNPLKLLL